MTGENKYAIEAAYFDFFFKKRQKGYCNMNSSRVLKILFVLLVLHVEYTFNRTDIVLHYNHR